MKKIISKPVKWMFLAISFAAISGLGSCLPLAAGAAAGYIAHDEGYRVSNPISKVDE